MIDAHFQKLFSLRFNIWKSWYIESIGLEPSKVNRQMQELHVVVDFGGGARFGLDGSEGNQFRAGGLQFEDQHIKNRARGFMSMYNVMNMIYFVCGELAIPFAQSCSFYPTKTAKGH